VKYRRFVIMGTVIAALTLINSIFSVLEAQASKGLLHQNTIELAAPMIDLAVTQVDVLTVTATRLDYRFVIKNEGLTTISMDGITYQTILSNDTTYGNSGDIPAGSASMDYYIAELGPGEEYTLTYYSNPTGVYFFDYAYFMVKIDASEYLEEDDETNNEGYAPLPDGPDLIVPTIDVLNINSNGVVYRFVVQNSGDGSADLDGPDGSDPWDNINFQGYLSINDTLGDGDDVPVGGGFILSPTELLPGDVFTYTMSAGMSGANYLDYRYIFVIIDQVDNLSETNESNNEGVGEIPYFIYVPLIQR